MKKKSPAFYRFCQDMASDHLSYYDPHEIEAAVFDLLDMNMMEDAEYLAEQGYRQHPNDESVEKLVIWIYLHNHKVERAEKMFEKYRNEESVWSIRLKFSLMVITGHPLKALEYFIEYLYNGKIVPMDWVNSVEEMFGALSVEVLEPFLIKAADFIEKDAESLGHIGSMLIDARCFEPAAKVIEKALDIDAYDIYSWQDLARCYMLLQNLTKGMEACEYGLAIDEKNPLLGFIKGYIHYQNMEYKECIPYLDNARKFAEGRMEARNLNMSEEEVQNQITVTYEMLGFAYVNLDKCEEARECFEILAERLPNQTSPWLQLANISLYQGDLNKANELIERAIQLDPKDEAALSLQISVLTSMHRFQDALAALKVIIRMRPKNKSYLVAYAELLLHSGQKKEADKVYRKLLKLDVKDKTFHQIILAYFQSIGDDDAVRQLTQE